MPRNEDKQRCGALTAVGVQCGGWARRGSVPPLCNIHDAGALPEGGKRRCTALRADGEACRAWAVRGTAADQADRPALCAAHGGLDAGREAPVAMVVDARQAARVERVGRQYDDHLSDLEFAILEAAGRDQSLEGEVRLVRVALRRFFAGFGEEESTSLEMDRRAETLFKGAELVARLLKYQRELEEGEDSFEAVMEQALIELGDEWGLELFPK